MGILFIVGTPIGNLEDISLRALRVLREVHLIAAEDTRNTRRLLRAHQIQTPLTSYHEFSGQAKLARVVETLADRDVALVSDAGMPGLSDPGYPLIRACIDAGIQVVPVPGPSAILAALVASGLPMHAFHFLGFLPRKSGPRKRRLQELAESPDTLVLFEAPHRLLACLADLKEVLGDRPATAARELTKIFEEIVRGSLTELQDIFARRAPRGEFTLVVAGAARSTPEDRERE